MKHEEACKDGPEEVVVELVVPQVEFRIDPHVDRFDHHQGARGSRDQPHAKLHVLRPPGSREGVKPSNDASYRLARDGVEILRRARPLFPTYLVR